MNDEYLATGFTDVDGASDTEVYSECLYLLDSLPYFKEYKRQTYELLELSRDDHVLDAGCGLGDDAYRMAELVSPFGRVVGLDSSEKLIEKAKADQRNNSLPVEFQLGNLKQLHFGDRTFTRCGIDRVLQHVAEPQIAISELVRVLKPGGLLLAYDNDWGTFSVTSRHKRITRILENLWCDSFTNCWIGRELQAYFVNAGLSSVMLYPSISVISDFDTADKVYNLKQTVKRGIETGVITEDEGVKWLNELKERSRAGYFASVLTAYIVVGRKSL